MTPTTFTILLGGSMVVTSIVWLYLLAITIRQYRSESKRSSEVY